MYKSIINTLSTVFANNTNNLPSIMKGVEPHKFKFKPDAKPAFEPRPKFSIAKAELINEWTKWACIQQLVEPAGNTSYASRLHSTLSSKN